MLVALNMATATDWLFRPTPRS